MKTNKLSVPISITAALVGAVACAVGCAKKNTEPAPVPAPPEAPNTNTVTANTNAPAAAPATNAAPETAVTVTNAPPAASLEITNPPPAETTTHAETISATDTNLPGHTAVVEMPATIPAAPTNFYPAEITSNAPVLTPVASACSTNFFVRLRLGYEHVYHGDNNDSYWAGIKFYAYGDQWRQNAGKNGWLIPDADAELSSGFVPKPDNRRDQGSDSGLRFRADFTWPWFHWTMSTFAREDSLCPFCKPLTFALGPTVNVGFDHLYNDGSDYRFAHYAGVRLTFNRDGFIEYTAGGTEGLDGTRQQVVAEIPFYESRDGEVRYYLRGLWNHGANNRPDILEGGLFLEMPFTTLVKPDKWGDLVPFAQ